MLNAFIVHFLTLKDGVVKERGEETPHDAYIRQHEM